MIWKVLWGRFWGVGFEHASPVIPAKAGTYSQLWTKATKIAWDVATNGFPPSRE
jgi:hypothetical protein